MTDLSYKTIKLQKTMLAKLIPIGNSIGVRIPKTLLHSYGVGTELEIISKGNQIILKPISKQYPRANWRSIFLQDLKKEVKKSEKIGFTKSKFDQQEWEW